MNLRVFTPRVLVEMRRRCDPEHILSSIFARSGMQGDARGRAPDGAKLLLVAYYRLFLVKTSAIQ